MAMSQTSYDSAADFAPLPEGRTSIMAVMSLVLGLVCIPILGLIGVILGIAALFRISRSEGALRGQGLAVAGIIIGLLVSMAWMGIGIGAAYTNQMFTQTIANPAASVLRAIDQGDYQAARNALSLPQGTTVTDEQLRAIGAAYQSELGNFNSMPESLGDRFMAYMEVGPLMQNLQGTQNIVPIPARFDKGMALLLVQLPTGAPPPSQGGGNTVPLLNVGVLTPSGKELWLVPRAGDPGSPPPAEEPAAPEGGG
jgi:uncharacterized membrane protein